MKRFAIVLLSTIVACSEEAAPSAPRTDSCSRCTRVAGDTGGDAGAADACVCLAPRFRSETFGGCLLGSPLRYDGANGTAVIVASGNGHVAAVSPESGKTLWNISLPAAEGK